MGPDPWKGYLSRLDPLNPRITTLQCGPKDQEAIRSFIRDLAIKG